MTRRSATFLLILALWANSLGCRKSCVLPIDWTIPVKPEKPLGKIMVYEVTMSANGLRGQLISPKPQFGVSPGFTTIRNKPAMPPYYRGRGELKYLQSESPGRGHGLWSDPFPILYQFDAFVTQFAIRDAGYVGGAYTTSRDGRLKASVDEVHFFSKDAPKHKNTQGLEILERHYDDNGKVTFSSWSEIDASTGFKLSEREVCGSKNQEYYFLWPPVR